ncbi:MAG: NADH:flavin oxidoreductase/NADH oxidase [Proteobacteria bacterium]|uniref:NADH:flavin oxidoreductase/NADH oxidase n=1 Tax=Aquabacterium sp. TaxID=1872578 RepID=UPI0035C69633|nr:NADH:flavin oxidoreductase/NADH oxidase [Pseudomonadota bacterium]
MSSLFSPFALGSLPLDNRIVIAPMCQYSAQDGCATDWHLMHLGSLALSGAALLIVEATAVSPEGRISPLDLGLWSDETEAALARVLAAVRPHSPIRWGIQLAHAGRKASVAAPWTGGAVVPALAGGWQTVAPSAVPFRDSDPRPESLDGAGLRRIRQAFVDAARRAQRLGFDVIEVHAAHGYLLHEFLSPLSNQRGDAHGGALEGRMRFPLEVVEAVREAVPDTVLCVRISATDWVPGGWDLAQSGVFAQALKARGCDAIHVSSGGLSTQQQIRLAPGYQLPFAEAIKREVGMPTIGVGLITEPAQAEAVVASGQADLVGLARAMLYNPRWPWHAAAALGARVHAPPQYLRCQPAGLRDLFQ